MVDHLGYCIQPSQHTDTIQGTSTSGQILQRIAQERRANTILAERQMVTHMKPGPFMTTTWFEIKVGAPGTHFDSESYEQAN